MRESRENSKLNSLGKIYENLPGKFWIRAKKRYKSNVILQHHLLSSIGTSKAQYKQDAPL